MSPPTAEQEAALAAAASSGATAIAAGAGAGKTTLLVEAVWRDIERDGVPLERILVASYNRAAAAHLTARLQARFADPDDGRGARRPGLDLSAAWVGTIHALAARIVRENPFAAGVDPEFGELDETEAASLVEQALDEALERSLTQQGFLDLVSDATGLGGVRDATRHVYERLRAAGHERPRIAVPDAPAPGRAQRDELAASIQEASAHPDARDHHHEQLARAAEMLLSGGTDAEAPRLRLNCTRAFRPHADRVNAAAAEVHQALLDREARDQLAGFAAHLEAFAERYAELKRERGSLDFEDLLLAARRVLRAGHGYRFARAYVDEFQDANALQAEIVDLLGAERTVVVGDGCQAIYGFRHADVEGFSRRAGDPPAVTLRDNHRSQEPLLHALNGLLGALLAGEPAFAPLRPAAGPRPGPALGDPPLEIVDVVSEDGERATRAQEAEVVADLVAGLRERGYRWPQIAVLFRSLTEVEAYRAALAARDIPAHLVAGRGFFTSEQIADTRALLALVENPLDEVALVRVLASPYAAVSDEDLVELRRAAGPAPDPGRWPAEGALLPAARRLAATRPAVEAAEALRPLLRERGLAGLVEAAVAARGYDLAVLGLPDGARRHANLRKLVRMAGDFAAVRGPDLRGFLRLLERMADAAGQDPGEAALVDPDLDAVRLATVHAVKGREFPAVVLADASHAVPGVAPMVIVDRAGDAGIRIARVGGKPAPALGYDRLRAAARAAEAAEERRIAYVAATRAERHLAVVGRSTARAPGDTTFRAVLDALGMGAPGVSVYPRGGRVGLVERRVAPAGDGRRARVVPIDPAPAPAPAPPAPPSPDPVAGRRLSFTGLETLATCARRFHLEHERGLSGRPEAPVPAPEPGREPAGAWSGTAAGDLVHRFLAGVDWDGPEPAAGWAAAAARAAGLPPSAVDQERAEGLVAGLMGSDLARRIRAGRARRAEEPFAIGVDGAVLSGAIDLVVDEGDGRVLVLDWKTHALAPGTSAADLVAGYRLQQALYALAALRGGAREAALCWAVLEDLPGSPWHAVEAAGACALEAEVAAALEPLRHPGRPAAARVPQPFCRGCPGLEAMCPVALAGDAR